MKYVVSFISAMAFVICVKVVILVINFDLHLSFKLGNKDQNLEKAAVSFLTRVNLRSKGRK